MPVTDRIPAARVTTEPNSNAQYKRNAPGFSLFSSSIRTKLLSISRDLLLYFIQFRSTVLTHSYARCQICILCQDYYMQTLPMRSSNRIECDNVIHAHTRTLPKIRGCTFLVGAHVCVASLSVRTGRSYCVAVALEREAACVI